MWPYIPKTQAEKQGITLNSLFSLIPRTWSITLLILFFHLLNTSQSVSFPLCWLLCCLWMALPSLIWLSTTTSKLGSLPLVLFPSHLFFTGRPKSSVKVLFLHWEIKVIFLKFLKWKIISKKWLCHFFLHRTLMAFHGPNCLISPFVVWFFFFF